MTILKGKLMQLEVQLVPTDTLILNPRNVKKHDRKDLDFIKSSFKRFGQQTPIIIDSSNVVRVGNGRLMAARALGWTHINVIKSDLSLTDLIAYEIVDNRSSDLSHYDPYQLRENIEYLENFKLEFKLEDVGFTASELEGIGDTLDEGSISDQLPSKSKSKLTSTEDYKNDLKSDKKGSGSRSKSSSSDDIDLPTSKPDGLQVIELIFDHEDFEEFIKYTAYLGKDYGTTNPTDTIMTCLRNAYKNLCIEVAD